MNEASLQRPRVATVADAAALSATTVSTSAVSWGAIVAGATGAAALSLILLILGTGLGLSSVSPWSGQGASAGPFGVSTILWVSITQLAAAGMGGYLAGRLRTRWASTHTDEVYFRDTAHGFLAWALATLVTAALLTSVIGGIVSGGAQAGAAVVGGAAAAVPAIAGVAKQQGASPEQGYFVDALLRKEAGAQTPATTTGVPAEGSAAEAKSASEIGRIFASAMSDGNLSPADAKYVGQLVSQRTGLSQADAEKKVNDIFVRMQTKAKELETTAREAADKARKASAYSAIWLFVSLLIGAFCASLAATYGGRRRDEF